MVEIRKTCFVVIDTLRARLVRRRPEDGSYITVETLSPTTDDRPGRLERDQPPARVHESVGATRHGIELQLNVRARAQAAFAKEVFTRLKELLQDGTFETFVLVAPTRMMGVLLGGMDGELEPVLIGQLPKNLTKVPDHRLVDHFGAISLKMDARRTNHRASVQ